MSMYHKVIIVDYKFGYDHFFPGKWERKIIKEKKEKKKRERKRI